MVSPNPNKSSFANFPQTNSQFLASSDEFQQETVDLFEENFSEQAVHFNNRADSLLDIALIHICLVDGEPNKHVTKVYDCSDHSSVSLLVECMHVDAKPILENFRSFGNADYARRNEMMNCKFPQSSARTWFPAET